MVKGQFYKNTKCIVHLENCWFFFLPVELISASEDLKRLSDRLVDVSATNMQLRMKLDEMEALEVSIKVHFDKTWRFCE